MKKSLIILALVSFGFIFSSCSKNNDKPSTSGLVGKWNLIKAVYIDNTTNAEETQPYEQGSYLQFDANGICYSLVDGDMNASNWHYIDNNSGIWIDNSSGFDVNDSGYIIKTLTSNTLELLSKELEDNATQTLYFNK